MSRTQGALAELRGACRQLPPVVREGLVSFADRADIVGEPAVRIFEHFAAYHVLRSAGLDDVDVTAAIVAGENDTQLDAVAILINDALVLGEDDVERLLADAIDGEPFRVRFLFVQATMSAKFPSDKVALFATGVLNFFLPESRLRQSPSLVRSRALKDRVLAACRTLVREAPEVDVYVVWPGTWTTEGHGEHARGVAEAALDTLQATGIIGAVRFHRIDSTRLQSLVVDETVANEGEIELTGLTETPPVAGIMFGCIGFVSANAYLACLTEVDPATGTQRLKDNAFHGNVRAFLGLGHEQAVNRGIRESILGEDGTEQGEFALRNNGVTIIAETVEREPQSARLRLKNFQVVNGCQTSHVLFQCREHISPALLLPIKIIATRNQGIAQNIILGLNRQTEIDELQILARNNLVRRLKRHFDVTSAARELWIDGERTPHILFERRTGEYRHIRDPHRARVVTMQQMMQAFAAAFIESPHSVHEGGKAYLIRQVPRRMLADDHDVGFYFAAALLLWRARLTFASLKEWRDYPAKHQLVFALRTLADPPRGCPPGRRDGEAHEYLRELRRTLLDDLRAGRLAAQAREIVDAAGLRLAASDPPPTAGAPAGPGPPRLTAEMAKREAFSDEVLTLCLEARAAIDPPAA